MDTFRQAIQFIPLKSGFAPNAYFIDVWSSEPPYDYYTSDGQLLTCEPDAFAYRLR